MKRWHRIFDCCVWWGFWLLIVAVFSAPWFVLGWIAWQVYIG